MRTIIFIFDGLRPDYITPETMPNLYALSKVGVYGARHHSVYPTVTRVNASSYTTGSYPATHGILGNTVYFPAIDSVDGLNTGEYSELERIDESTHGHLLTAISLGEALQQAGHQFMVFSSGSTGQAFLQNHTISGGAIIHPELILPPPFKEELIKALGEPPPESTPNLGQHEWITNAFLRFGLPESGPLVSAIWYSDPDGTAHRDGVGAPTTLSAISYVDGQFGRILQAIKDQHLEDRINVIVTADHGFVTHRGDQSLTDFLIASKFKSVPKGADVVIAGGAIHVRDHDPAIVRAIANALMQQRWAGALFTAEGPAGKTEGMVPGTLSFNSIHWNHPERTADILVAPQWNDEPNDFGFKGSDETTGVAGHGGLSPYEVHIPLVAAGPGFKDAYQSELPTSNVDIVPSILSLSGIPVPPTMTGRPMTELFKISHGGQPVPETRIDTVTTVVETAEVHYSLMLVRSWVGTYYYVDYAKVTRP